MSSEGKRWTINVCTCGGSGMNEPPDHWTHDGPHEVEEIEVVPASKVERLVGELRQANHEKHMNATKVLSRDSIIEQLSETQLAKDVASAEAEVERLREAVGNAILAADDAFSRIISAARAALADEKEEA